VKFNYLLFTLAGQKEA